MLLKMTENTTALRKTGKNDLDEAAPGCRQTNTTLHRGATRTTRKPINPVIDTAGRKGDIGAHRRPTRRARVRLRRTRKVVGKNIDEETKALARHQSAGANIDDVTEGRVAQGADLRGSTKVAKRKGGARRSPTVTAKAELLANTGRPSIAVVNTRPRRKDTSEGEGLQALHLDMKGRVRRTENVRRQPEGHQGGFLFIGYVC